MFNKFIHTLAYIVMFMMVSVAQSTELERIKTALFEINKNFDSAHYLAFDVDIKYATDTVLGRSESDREFASYIFDGSKIYYKAGAIEYMQNDSFIISTDREEQRMVVAKATAKTNSNLFPLRDFVDSVVRYFSDSYKIVVSGVDTFEVITFSALTDNLPFQEFSIRYYVKTKLLDNLQITYLQESNFNEPNDSTTEQLLTSRKENPLIKKRLSMQFSNYRFINDPQIFRDDNYLYFDRNRKAYIAAGKFTGYKIIASNIETVQPDFGDIETTAPEITEDTK